MCSCSVIDICSKFIYYWKVPCIVVFQLRVMFAAGWMWNSIMLCGLPSSENDIYALSCQPIMVDGAHFSRKIADDVLQIVKLYVICLEFIYFWGL